MMFTALAAATAGCSNRVHVYGTFDEVWERTEEAMQAARFEVAGRSARYERVERDPARGTLKYVWTKGTVQPVRVVELSIEPAADSPGAPCPALPRVIRINAWSWTLFGWMQFPDGQATGEVFTALMDEFGRERIAVAPLAPPDPESR